MLTPVNSNPEMDEILSKNVAFAVNVIAQCTYDILDVDRMYIYIDKSRRPLSPYIRHNKPNPFTRPATGGYSSRLEYLANGLKRKDFLTYFVTPIRIEFFMGRSNYTILTFMPHKEMELPPAQLEALIEDECCLALPIYKGGLGRAANGASGVRQLFADTTSVIAVTYYEPVPNSLEERPTMLDLLQGNLNSINDIYNS